MNTRVQICICTAGLATLAYGCPGSAPRLPNNNNGDITVTPRSDSGVVPDTGVDAPDGGVDAPDSGVTSPDGGPSEDGGTPPEDAGVGRSGPTINSAALRQAGREGQDLQVRVTGSDLDSDAVAVVVRFLDGVGDEVFVADTDLNGRPDSGKLIGAPKPAVTGQVDFEAVATFPRLLERQASIAAAEVWLLDSYAMASAPVSVELEPQLVAAFGEACDPTYSFDRCEEGLGCAGAPPTCIQGSNPQLSSLDFITTPTGPKVVIRGFDADDDPWRVRLEFLNAGGGAVSVDLDADGTPDADAFEIDATHTSEDGAFVVSLLPADNFPALVPQLAAVAYDMRQEGGNRLTAAVEAQPRKANGTACDPFGADACYSGSVCYPGVPGVANACADRFSRRSAACRQAPILSAATPRVKVVGVADGVSLWDAPNDCAALDPKDRPEGIAMLSLPRGAQRVTLTTDREGTGFDTVLYVLNSCDRPNPTSMACSDSVDQHMGSEVVLHDLAAGQYLVVVDSWNPYGGVFELEAIIVE